MPNYSAGSMQDFLHSILGMTSYANMLPENDIEALHSIVADSSNTYGKLQEFLGLMGVVARQTVYDSQFDRADNPFARFWREPLPVGETIQDIFVNPQKGNMPKWDDDGSYMLSRRKSDVRTAYHTVNFEWQNKASTSIKQSLTAFLSLDGVARVQQEIVNTLKTSAEYAFFLQSLELLSMVGILNYCKGVATTNPVDADSSATFLKALKKTVREFGFFSNLNNKEGVLTKTDKRNIVVFIKGSTLDTVGIDLLAGVFQLKEIDYDYTFITVPENYGFGSILDSQGVIAIAIDEQMLRIVPQFFEASAAFNGASFVTNNFLTARMIFSAAPFFNGALLYDKDIQLNANVGGTATPTKIGDTVTLTGSSDVYAVGQKQMKASEVTNEVVVGPEYVVYNGDTDTHETYVNVEDNKAVLLAEGVSSIKMPAAKIYSEAQ